MGWLSSIFGSAQKGLEDRPILEIAPGFFDDDTPETHEARVVNFRNFVETGRAPEEFRDTLSNQYIDLASDDPYTRALRQVENNVAARIEASPEMQELLARGQWNRDDRVAWERTVSGFVNEEHRQIKGLATYRNISEPETYRDTKERAVRLNDLAQDIHSGGVSIEHDCESMSIFEGYVLQKLDDRFLPDEAPAGDFRQSTNYFYAVGRTNFSLGNNGGVHAYIVSPATMNVVEGAEISGNPYKENINPEMTFEDFVNGGMVVNSDTSIYSGLHHTLEDFTRVRFDRGEISVAKIFESMPDRRVLTDEAYEKAPPEAQTLIDLKTQIVQLEELKESGCTPAVTDLDRRITTLNRMFSDSVGDLVDQASIYEAMNFASQTNRIVPSRPKVADLEGPLREMHPGLSNAEIRSRLFDIEIGTIPEMEQRGISDYEEFRTLKAREFFAEANPGMDYEEARQAFNSSATNNRVQAMYRGEATRADILAEPDTRMALAYTEAHQRSANEFPKPATVMAYARVGDRIEAFMDEYKAMKNEGACRALDQQGQSPLSRLASILGN